MASDTATKTQEAFKQHVDHHVLDSYSFDLPNFLGGPIHIPGFDGIGLPISKFMVLQILAGLLTLWVFSSLARKIRSGEPLSSKFWNFWEMLAVAVRDQVVRPTIGDPHHDHHEGHEHDDTVLEEPVPTISNSMSHEAHVANHPADKFLPLIWTFFFYILFNNLLGLIPWLGSATGNINVTGPLALCVFVASTYYGVQAMGPGGFLKNLAPELKGLGVLGVVIIPLMYLIEGISYFIKHAVLAIRLFANMYGGHMVLATLLTYIWFFSDSSYWYGIMPASVLTQSAILLLETFVAFLQAYVFAFLATLFIASTIHHH